MDHRFLEQVDQLTSSARTAAKDLSRGQRKFTSTQTKERYRVRAAQRQSVQSREVVARKMITQKKASAALHLKWQTLGHTEAKVPVVEGDDALACLWQAKRF